MTSLSLLVGRTVNINVYSFKKLIVGGHADCNMDKTIASNVYEFNIVVGNTQTLSFIQVYIKPVFLQQDYSNLPCWLQYGQGDY